MLTFTEFAFYRTNLYAESSGTRTNSKCEHFSTKAVCDDCRILKKPFTKLRSKMCAAFQQVCVLDAAWSTAVLFYLICYLLLLVKQHRIGIIGPVNQWTGIFHVFSIANNFLGHSTVMIEIRFVIISECNS